MVRKIGPFEKRAKDSIPELIERRQAASAAKRHAEADIASADEQIVVDLVNAGLFHLLQPNWSRIRLWQREAYQLSEPKAVSFVDDSEVAL